MPEPRESFLQRATARFDSKPFAVCFIIACAVLAALLEYATHLTVDMFAIPPSMHAALDACVVSGLTLLLVSTAVTAIRRRRKYVLDAVQTVAELNHHVRNALQVIRDAHYLPEDEQADAVIGSVDRIDTTLRRLFPGRPDSAR